TGDVSVKYNLAGSSVSFAIQNTNAAGISGLGFLDSSSIHRGTIGVNNSGGNLMLASGDRDIIFHTRTFLNQERMRIVSASGNVGIGTTNPTTKLFVSASTGTAIFGESFDSPSGLFQTSSASNSAPTLVTKGGLGATADLFQAQNNAGAVLTVINSSGNLGIGTTAPAAKLQVVGNMIATDNGTFGVNQGRVEVNYDGTSNSALINTYKDGLGGGVLALNPADGKVVVSSRFATNAFSVSPEQYGYLAGTASQLGTTITGVGTTFTAAMVGSQFAFINGVLAGTITAYNSPTSLTVTTSQTVAAQNYEIDYTGLQVTSAGNVGIGTTNPASQLEVNSATSNVLRMSSSNTSSFPTIGLYGQPNGGGEIWGQLIFGFNSNGDKYAAMKGLRTGATTGALTFHTSNDSAATLPERVRFDENGNVGIGTPSPAAKLDVAGDIRVGNSAALCNGTTIGSQRYNSGSNKMEFCDGIAWGLIGVSSGGTVTNVSGTAPITVINNTTTPVVSIAKATGAVDGYLASADFTTFNNKESALA
ncbi:MAG: hypothetical protein AABZ55_06460, partial [Bdellovibrionota bacterium]